VGGGCLSGAGTLIDPLVIPENCYPVNGTCFQCGGHIGWHPTVSGPSVSFCIRCNISDWNHWNRKDYEKATDEWFGMRRQKPPWIVGGDGMVVVLAEQKL